MTARYIHDCEECEYLGQFLQYDCYYCPTCGDVVARYSSDGPDYHCTPAVMTVTSPSLVVTKAMAEQAGYLKSA